MRSAPTMTQSTCPVAIAHAAAESIVSRCAMPASANSHAVSRAPCSSGRVSSTSTSATLPRACSTRSAPSAVPTAVVASRPVLQCVSTRSGRSGHSRSTRSAAWVASIRLTRASSASICWASASTASGPAGNVASARRTPQARFTAVGRADAIRAASDVVLSVSPTCVYAASATPKAPATPSAGAPRMARVLIASMSSSTRGDPQPAQLARQQALVNGQQCAVGPGDRAFRDASDRDSSVVTRPIQPRLRARGQNS